jgi:periplasmic protein CpxP/Spy
MNVRMATRSILMTGILAATVLTVAQGPAGPVGSRIGPGFADHRSPFERALGPEGGMQWWNNPKIVEQLKLTDDQRKAMDGILQDQRMKLVDLHANLEKAELAMEPLMKADTPNETAILAQIDKVAQARADLEKANARFLLALRAKLTPDQWKQMQQMRETSRTNHRGWGPDGRRPSSQFRQQAPPPPAGGQPGGPPAPPPGGEQ